MTVLAVVIALAVVVSSVLLIRGVRRLRGRAGGAPAQVHDVLEGAFLAGGPGRVVDAVIAGMQADGRLTIGGPASSRWARATRGATSNWPWSRSTPPRPAAPCTPCAAP